MIFVKPSNIPWQVFISTFLNSITTVCVPEFKLQVSVQSLGPLLTVTFSIFSLKAALISRCLFPLAFMVKVICEAQVTKILSEMIERKNKKRKELKFEKENFLRRLISLLFLLGEVKFFVAIYFI